MDRISFVLLSGRRWVWTRRGRRLGVEFEKARPSSFQAPLLALHPFRQSGCPLRTIRVPSSQESSLLRDVRLCLRFDVGGISYPRHSVLFVLLHAVIPSKIMRASSLVLMGLSSVLYDEKPFELALSVVYGMPLRLPGLLQPAFSCQKPEHCSSACVVSSRPFPCQWVWSINSFSRHFLSAGRLIPKPAVCFSSLNMNSSRFKSHHRP